VTIACAAPTRETEEEAELGPVVLIVLSGLRADAVGALGGTQRLTPNLNALAEEADFASAAVAPASATGPAIASLFTGLSVWQHHGWFPEQPLLGRALRTLPEALGEAGYETYGYCQLRQLRAAAGFSQGFTEYFYVERLRAAHQRLSGLSGGRQFVWVYLRDPRPPYVRRDRFLPRLESPPPGLPKRVRGRELLPYFDPEKSPSPGQRRVFRAMYELSAARADELLGRLLSSVRQSGQWDRTLVAVTSDHGTELGEHGQIGWGGNLGRKLLEVPLVIKLPRTAGLSLAAPSGSRVGTVRLWATLVRAAGADAPPGVAPSLFEEGFGGALSELYGSNGWNRFSWVEGDLQLVASSSFAPAAEGYYRADSSLWGLIPPAPGLSPNDPFARLRQAFLRTGPFSSPSRFRLQRWSPGGRSLPVRDPAAERRLVRHLEQRWTAFLDEELPPSRELSQEVF
jgi:hypothetical protein